MRKNILIILFAFSFSVFSQYIPQHQDYTAIYDLVDELANDGIIELNSVVKPYSRAFIAESFVQAKASDKLTSRQKKEIDFYLNEFALEQNKLPEKRFVKIVNSDRASLSLIEPAYRYKDDLLRVKVNPLLGGNVYSNKNGFMYKRWVGAEFQTMIGKNFSMYASLRDMVQPENLLVRRQYYNQKITNPYNPITDTLVTKAGYIRNEYGGAYKLYGPSGGDYSEMRGGMYYSWKWGHLGLVKDHITFGDAYNGSNIISNITPSFPHIKLNIKPAKWVELNYIHAWLVSMALDSTNYYLENTGEKKYWYKRKYLAANMLTIKPIKSLHISVGNSIIYCEDNVQPAYLIPLMFYKSIDHTLTRDQSENQNSQFFINFSSRNIKHLHLYGSAYVDELSFYRYAANNPERNPISYKVGGRLSNFPLKNLQLTAEYTLNDIITYKHSIPSLDYTSNGYPLGSYLGDNATELYLALAYKPIARLNVGLSYTHAKKGNDYQYIREDKAIKDIISQPFMKDVVWQNQTLTFKASYELFNNATILFQVDWSDINTKAIAGALTTGEVWQTADEYMNMYTSKYLQGENTTIMVGMNYGF